MEFVFGADLSLLQYIQDHGMEYRERGHVADPLAVFAGHGVGFIRLRLFVQPDGRAGQVNDLPYTLALARRVRAAGLKFLLDLHYSDGWADPQSQAVPASWAGQSLDALTETVRAYTADVLRRCDAAGCLPDMVQVGNEITNGMLWPLGSNATAEGWDRFARLLQAGIRGTRDGGYGGEIMIHVDQGGNKAICEWFYDGLQARGVPFDIIGLSYYPFWHGTLTDLAENLASLAARYHRPIIVVETGHDWRGDAETPTAYPPTPGGQREFLAALTETVRATPGGRGAGVFYWAPEWVCGSQWHGPDWSSVWESRALFDDSGNALPALEALGSARELVSTTR